MLARGFATEPEMCQLDETDANLDPAERHTAPRPPRETGHVGASGMNDREPSGRESPVRQSSGRGSSGRGSSGRGLIITLLVSFGLHLAALVTVLLLLHAGGPVADGPEQPVEVELVMEEHKGDLRPTATSPQPPANPAPPPSTPVVPPSVPPSVPPAARTAVDASAQAPEATPQQEKDGDIPVAETPPAGTPTPSTEPVKEAERDTTVREAKQAAQPSPPAAQDALTVTLSGTDSPSDARAWGDQVIPARPDAVFHNRPPEYPAEAAMNGEHGTVILIIHVSPAGSTAGVEVLRSSGYALLDGAAREAVMRWRFMPAVKGGQAVPSDMRMGFVFDFQ